MARRMERFRAQARTRPPAGPCVERGRARDPCSLRCGRLPVQEVVRIAEGFEGASVLAWAACLAPCSPCRRAGSTWHSSSAVRTHSSSRGALRALLRVVGWTIQAVLRCRRPHRYPLAATAFLKWVDGIELRREPSLRHRDSPEHGGLLPSCLLPPRPQAPLQNTSDGFSSVDPVRHHSHPPSL